MQYNKFIIHNYRAIKGPLTINLKNKIVPLVGINECGKTTILQAIFAFDSANDDLNNSKHISNIGNLYALEDDVCKIEAVIDINKDEFINIITLLIENNNNIIIKNEGKLEELNENTQEWKNLSEINGETEEENKIYETLLQVLKSKVSDEILQINIARILSDNDKNEYSLSFKHFNRIENFDYINNKLSKKIVNSLPPILYSDDFNDRPAGEVEITKEGNASEWERIYSRVFNNALKKQEFHIYSLLDEDARRRKSTLSDVSKYLSDNLTEAWSRFSNEKKKITISFDLEERKEKDDIKRYLLINIVENVNGQERIFGISDRSKGFIWYYNFIMKIQFNPKQNRNNNTIFLLDEPGSYLHETAQNELCKKLLEISKEEGVVIYCTHSPQLLNPSYIPLSTINIVSKTKSKVSCVPISSYKTRSTQTTAFQPIYEALQIPEFKLIDSDKKIVAGEGIYDKYAIEMFCDLPKNVIAFGSANAKSLHDNIQYFIAFAIKYMAIWDNDPEGNNHYKNATNDFGQFESENFYVLPNLHNKSKVRMEEMFEPEDMELINDTLGLPRTSSYTLTMGSLYYSQNREKILTSIKSKLSKKCKDNFMNLSSTIKKHFD